MSENLHNIDDHFRQNLDPIKSEPGSRVWEQIEHALDKDENSRIRSKYMRWRRWAVAATLLLSISLFALYISNQKAVNSVAADKNKIEEKSRLPKNKTPELTEEKPGSNKNLANKEPYPETASEPALSRNESKKNIAAPLPASDNRTVVKTEEENHSSSKNKNEIITAKATPSRGQTTIEEKKKMLVVPKKDLLASKENKRRQPNDIASNAEHEKGNTYTELSTGEKSEEFANKENSKANVEFAASGAEVINKSLSPTKIKSTEILRNTSLIRPSPYTAAAMPATQKMKLPKPAKTNIGYGVTIFYEPQARFTKVEEGMKRHREDDRNEIKEGERVQTASTYGLLIDHKFRSNWRIQTGIGITEQSSLIETKPIFARKDDIRGGGGNGNGEIKYKFNCAAGTVFIDPKTGSTLNTGDSVLALSSINSNKYLQIPLRVSYAFSWGKFSMAPTVGVQSNILRSSTLNTTLVDNAGTKTPTSTQIEGLRSMFLTAEIGLGLEYNISKRLSVYVMPRTGFSLSPINKETPVRTYTKDISAVSGLRFQL